MTKAVLHANVNSIYDDLPEERYHFPKQYLKRIEALIGDWIIYYEPRRNNGRMVYFATAQITDVDGDNKKQDHYYARIDNYLEFEHPVPFKQNGIYYQTSLLNADGKLNSGRIQNSVQHITEEEYQTILQLGYTPIISSNNFSSSKIVSDSEQDLFERPIIQSITNRPFRDRTFAEAVKVAYNKTCAMTGLRIINGGGRPEVQAAHIRPVAEKGPDSVRNGLALCSTVHWMFDRGLISLNDDFAILKTKEGIPEAIDRMLKPEGHILLPDRPDLYPHPSFLKFHREQVFKG